MDESPESWTAGCGDHSLPIALRFSCPPQRCQRRIGRAVLSAIAVSAAGEAAMAKADALGGFAFDSDTENQTKSHRVAASRSDFSINLCSSVFVCGCSLWSLGQGGSNWVKPI